MTVQLGKSKGKDDMLASPLYYAAALGFVGIAKRLIMKYNHQIDEKGKSSRTALYIACKKGNIGLVPMLLEKGADVTVASNTGWTPLNSASDSGHVDVVKLLLEKGADITVANNNGWTPLNSASKGGHLEVVKVLLNKGANVLTANYYNVTPLSAAAREGDANIVAFLLTIQGIETDGQDSLGRTSLCRARRRGHSEIVQVLDDREARDARQADEYEMTVEADSASRHSSSIWCDICTFGIWKNCTCYQCTNCSGGNFHICRDCYDMGGRCPNISHALVASGP